MTRIRAKEIFSGFADVVSVTEGVNGYPEPEVGIGVLPGSHEDLIRLQDAVPEGVLYQFHQRDGWACWEGNGTVFESYLDISKLERVYGDDYSVVYLFTEDHKRELACNLICGYASPKEFIDSIDNSGKYKTLEDLEKAIQEFIKALSIGYNVLYGNKVYETFGEFPVKFYYDTHHYRIGLYLPYDSHSQD